MSEPMARWIFGLGWAAFVAMRLFFHVRAGAFSKGRSPWEGLWVHVLRLLFGPPFLVFIALYLFHPAWTRWATVPLGPAWRWTGAVLFLSGVGLVTWVNVTLGRNFSGSLILQDDHQLIESGPYRRVRHPMYPSFLVMIVGMGLLTATWVLGGVPMLAVLAVMIFRTPVEEAMMLERFGDDYSEYMSRTGRFLPRLGPIR